MQVRITPDFANTLLCLQKGGALVKNHIGFHRVPAEYAPYCWEPRIPDEVGQTLIKNKLVRRRSVSHDGYNWWHGWFNYVWVLSDVGKEFKLPPMQYWLEA